MGEQNTDFSSFRFANMSKTSGGIRGIVELEILRLIELHLGGIPIRNFFDLVVGTRYILLE